MERPPKKALYKEQCMMKNLLILVVLTWVTMSYAKTKVSQETLADADSYKIEKPVHEEAPKRSVAGGKMKKKSAESVTGDAPKTDSTESSDSEVRYWQYSE